MSCTVSRSTVSLRAAGTPRASVGALLRSARQWAIGRRHHPFPHQQAVRALGAWATCLHVQRHFGASGSLVHIASVFTPLREALTTSAITSRISLNVLLFLPLNFEYSLHVQELPPSFVKKTHKRQCNNNSACGARVGCRVSTRTPVASCVAAMCPSVGPWCGPRDGFPRKHRIRASRSKQVFPEHSDMQKKKSTLQTKTEELRTKC